MATEVNLSTNSSEISSEGVPILNVASKIKFPECLWSTLQSHKVQEAKMADFWPFSRPAHSQSKLSQIRQRIQKWWQGQSHCTDTLFSTVLDQPFLLLGLWLATFRIGTPSSSKLLLVDKFTSVAIFGHFFCSNCHSNGFSQIISITRSRSSARTRSIAHVSSFQSVYVCESRCLPRNPRAIGARPSP